MDLFTAFRERTSCRNFLSDSLDSQTIKEILEAGTFAPSPLNAQPWKFTVITNSGIKEKIYQISLESKKEAIEKSGWKWLENYSVDFLKQAPVIVAVTGDSRKSGVDSFSKEGPTAYQHGCAAAIQNILLAAHAKGLASLWYTMFDKEKMKALLNTKDHDICLALICLGRAAEKLKPVPRKSVEEKIIILD